MSQVSLSDALKPGLTVNRASLLDALKPGLTVNRASLSDALKPGLPVNRASLSDWLTTYLRYEIEVDTPIIEAVGIYYRYVKRRVAIYNIPDFICPHDIDPVILMVLIQRNGAQLEKVPLRLKTPELCWAAITNYPLAIRWVPTQTKALCLYALERAGDAGCCEVLKWIKELRPKYYMAMVLRDGLLLAKAQSQSERLCLAACQQNGGALQYVRHQTSKICLAAVRENGLALCLVKNLTRKVCLAAVTQNGLALKYIFDRTLPYYNEVALAAVRSTPSALGAVPQHLRTFKLCSLAVGLDGTTLDHVPYELQHGYPELAFQAVTQNGLALQYARIKTPALCLAAIEQNWRAIQMVTAPVPPDSGLEPVTVTAQMLCLSAMGQLAEAAQLADGSPQLSAIIATLEQMVQ